MQPVMGRPANRSARTSEIQQSTSKTTNTTTTIIPASLRPFQQRRAPLQSRDNNANVIMRAPQKGAPDNSRSGNNAAMGYDKQTTARPSLPTLSAAPTKTSNKPPLTPRVLGSNHTQATTPLSRRGPRPEGTPTGGHNQDLSTPISSFLANNITPRSSTRKIRVDSPGNTPTSTPVPESLRFSGSDTGFDAGTRRPTAPFSPAGSDIGNRRSQIQATNDDKFFYASDAKNVPLAAPPRPAIQNRGSTFLYANGEAIPPPVSSSGSTLGSTVGSAVGEERSQPKFLHANGLPDLQPSAPNYFPKSGSTVSTSSHVTSPRLAPSSANTFSAQQRPLSPHKMHQTLTPTVKNIPSLTSTVLPRPSLGRGQATQPKRDTRKVSIELPPRPSNEKAAHLSGLDLAPLPRRISINTPLTSPSLMGIPTPGILGFALPAEDSQEDQFLQVSNTVDDSSSSELHSPVKAGHSLEHLNELAANARRERKVLDLEIRNSSLEAINRTLERQLRKQNAELRRFRRLSRSGRLSIATAASTRTSSGSLSVIGEDTLQLSDMSEGELDSEEVDDDSDDFDEGALSPGAMAESDLRHRKKDEKRLQLDLSKHQQLLIDSQKMNQSLKKCLGWSEEMINEGKKALEYHVRVSDIELGGRVLLPEELGHEDEESFLPPLSETDDAEDSYMVWDDEAKEDREDGNDRDSGNDLDALLAITNSPFFKTPS